MFIYRKDKSSFIDKANKLLEAIWIERAREDTPLIFLAYSIGGLLIKQALVNTLINPKYRLIKYIIKGLMFFAILYNSGDNTLVSLGIVALKIAYTVGF